MTVHADEEADEDSLSILDIESTILTGEILERQRDHDSGEWKYVVSGETLDGREVCVVAKFGAGKGLMILTVYED